MFSRLKKLLGAGFQKDEAVEPSVAKPVASEKKENTIRELPEKESPRPSVEKKGGKTPDRTAAGIRKIDQGEDLYRLFGGEEIDRKIKKEAGKKPAPEKKPVRIPKKTGKKFNKQGLLLINDGDDLLGMFEAESEPAVQPSPRASVGGDGDRPTAKAPERKPLKDKHGIPILKEREDYSGFFLDENEPDKTGESIEKLFREEEEFARMLDESLGGKEGAVLLREKKDNMVKSKPLTLKQRIKRYPSPQGQLDLHGFTAMKADQRAESYLRSSYKAGTYTVRIIVGKGLHSKEGAVLPDVVEDRLIRLKNEKVVLAWEWENKTKSKSGAVIAYLNNYHLDG